MVFNATFNNISATLYILAVSFFGWRKPEKITDLSPHWQTLSHNVVSNTPHLNGVRTHNVSGDRHWLQI